MVRVLVVSSDYQETVADYRPKYHNFIAFASDWLGRDTPSHDMGNWSKALDE
jgi:hypothetical protein